MMNTFALISFLLRFVSASVFTPQSQQILRGNIEITEADIKYLLATHNDDPVEVMRLIDPAHAEVLNEPRLIEVFGTEPVWLTEGDKLRFKKQGLSFIDLTGHENISMFTASSNKDISTGPFFWRQSEVTR